MGKSQSPGPSAATVAALAFVGVVLLQAAWILATPPFRGSDEFDHVYRAAGVAEGQWRLTEPADNGRGLLVRVPATIVEAAAGQCEALPYTGPDNCHPVKHVSQGLVVVATASGAYNPLYYAVIGYPTRGFDGASADYAMRIFSAVLCALGVAAAAACLSLTKPGVWTWLGFLVALTPVLVYTTVLPAPNSVEIVAGLCLWCSLIALTHEGLSRRARLAIFGTAAVAACLLAGVRALGPLWLGLIVISAVAFLGARRAWSVVRESPALVALTAAAAGAAVVGGAWWTQSAGLTGQSSDIQVEVDASADVATWIGRVLVWTLQIIGAFPYRDQPAPLGVYALYFVVFSSLLVAAVRAARGRERLTLVALALGALVLPIVLTLLTAPSQGVIWQGRYMLALMVGLPILCGVALDRARPARGNRAAWVAIALLAVAHAWAVWDVARDESRRPVSADDPSWFTIAPAAIGVLALVGVATLGLVLRRPGEKSPSSSDTETPARPTA